MDGCALKNEMYVSTFADYEDNYDNKCESEYMSIDDHNAIVKKLHQQNEKLQNQMCEYKKRLRQQGEDIELLRAENMELKSLLSVHRFEKLIEEHEDQMDDETIATTLSISSEESCVLQEYHHDNDDDCTLDDDPDDENSDDSQESENNAFDKCESNSDDADDYDDTMQQTTHLKIDRVPLLIHGYTCHVCNAELSSNKILRVSIRTHIIFILKICFITYFNVCFHRNTNVLFMRQIKTLNVHRVIKVFPLLMA